MSQLTRSNGHFLPGLLDLTKDWLDLNNNSFSSSASSIPAVNIRETSDGFDVEVAAPGMSKKDFRIELENNVLIIHSEKQNETEKKDGERYTRREFSYQSFQRSFTLPDVADAEKINARYDNGVLYLSIPKKEEAKPKPPKQITIK